MDTTYNLLNAYRMNFITNHDENSWTGTIQERLGDGAEVFAMLSFTLPGMPLLYSGQEVGLDKRLEFFEKDMIDWNYDSEWVSFYTKLIELKHANEALWNGDFGSEYVDIPSTEEEKILAFKREKGENKIFVMANLTDNEVVFSLTNLDMIGSYRDIINDRNLKIENDHQISLGGWEYFVLMKEE
jgi:1,4-alpha-glucan branching enzyme